LMEIRDCPIQLWYLINKFTVLRQLIHFFLLESDRGHYHGTAHRRHRLAS